MFIVVGMDTCLEIERAVAGLAGVPLPPAWLQEPALAEFGSLVDVVAVGHRLDARGDAVLAALVGVSSRPEVASLAIIAALMPWGLVRCRADQDRAADLVAELAIVVGEERLSPRPTTGRRLGNVLLDRAWDRVRAPSRRRFQVVPVDPSDRGWDQPGTQSSPEDVVVERLSAWDARAAVIAVDRAGGSLARSWNSALVLFEKPDRTPSEQERWKYVRARLRRSLPADLVA